MWSVLFATLPTRPNAVRVRLWRALKALGTGALRDGAFVLPLAQVAALDALADEVRANGGSATVFELVARDEPQQRELLALFDRSEAYTQWRATAQTLQQALAQLSETEARRRWRQLNDSLALVQRTDYFAGAPKARAADAAHALREAIDAQFSTGEPLTRAEAPLARLDAGDFQGKRWATRQRPWVDRLACAWLLRRFIDRQARFVWLIDPARPPRGVIGFDYDGARFTHVGSRVSFEVIAASFGLDADARLRRIAALVHTLDVGGAPVAEAAGLEAVLAGLLALHADDDNLLEAASAVFDALYASGGENP